MILELFFCILDKKFCAHRMFDIILRICGSSNSVVLVIVEVPVYIGLNIAVYVEDLF